MSAGDGSADGASAGRRPPADPDDVREIPRERRWKIRRWWERLPPGRNGVEPHLLFDRGALARLRRAGTPLDILDEAVVFHLHRGLGYGPRQAADTLVPVAVAACVLARVAADSPARSLATVLGPPYGEANAQPLLSPLRLKRLTAACDPDDLLRQMRRAVDLAGDRPVDVAGLGETILDWLHPERGDRARATFAFDYHAAAHRPPGRAPEPPAA
ncbi:CRISPR system Cascade subunit CasB [Methylobacterium sp. 174MFSha1.1]|uniref:type I-E CRISPR-associated protein Cse2/CasB n=1 Tax=Methylobacterium sp. 174MFSha1.1 TaxID=1502749 RepID=UPI0008EF8A71|nr:type I-E CRISPR-associated protein Cse2/CasB [Methylobacterium sp. 174MFSha1.1]SFU39504.1 CRISPR system Cascade subunit CasB [Methylobacterium sp. 174MFSha1.1]